MRTREEQIEEMVQVNSAYLCHEDYTSDDLRMMLAAAISEAEERARAECAADTRRLEWMVNRSIRIETGFGEPCPRTVLDSCDDILARSIGDFRAAIDAAMEGGNE